MNSSGNAAAGQLSGPLVLVDVDGVLNPARSHVRCRADRLFPLGSRPGPHKSSARRRTWTTAAVCRRRPAGRRELEPRARAAASACRYGGYPKKRAGRCREAGFSASAQGLWVQAPGCRDVEQAGKVVMEPGNPVEDDDLTGAQRPVVIG